MLRVRGYAAVFGNVDSEGDRVKSGAFSKWIADNPDESLDIYWQHSPRIDPLATPVGNTTLIKQDRFGLYYEGWVYDTPGGLELQASLNGRKRRPASFAYKATNFAHTKTGRDFLELQIGEITAAQWGANPKAYMELMPDQENEP